MSVPQTAHHPLFCNLGSFILWDSLKIKDMHRKDRLNKKRKKKQQQLVS